MMMGSTNNTNNSRLSAIAAAAALRLLHLWALLCGWLSAHVARPYRAWYERRYHGCIVRVVKYDVLALRKRRVFAVGWLEQAAGLLLPAWAAPHTRLFKFCPGGLTAGVEAYEVTCWNGARYLIGGTRAPDGEESCLDARRSHDRATARFLYAALAGADVTAYLNGRHVVGLTVWDLAVAAALDGALKLADVTCDAAAAEPELSVVHDNLFADEATYKGVLRL